MNYKIKYSIGSKILTTSLIMVVVGLGGVFFIDHLVERFVVLAVCAGVCAVVTLWYAPVSIAVNKHGVTVYRPLRKRVIPFGEIASVSLCPPTLGAVREVGSGGFFGYWGWFKEGDIGEYFAYFGRASDCFLVTLKSGRKYVLGCVHASDAVEQILRNIK